MKIAFITVGYLPMPPVRGGAVENLIDIVLRNNELSADHDITVFSCESKEALEFAGGYKKSKFIYINNSSLIHKLNKVNLHVINKFSKRYRGNAFIRKVATLISLSNENFDAIIIENRPEYAITLRKVYKGKIIIHLHNNLLNDNVKFANSIMDSCDAIFTVSNFIKNEVSTISNNKYIKTLYNGIDTNKFNKEYYSKETHLIKSEYNIQNDDIVILYSGRMNAAKGVDKLLEAFIKLPKSLKIKLLIVGSSVYGENIEDPFLIKLKDLANNRKEDIIFTGYIDYSEIPKIHAISDIAIIPSIWDDPSPLTVYEAMSSGLPIITTDSGGIPELVNTNCAIIIKRNSNIVNELCNAMKLLVTNDQLRENMSAYCKVNSPQYDKNIYVENFNELLTVLIK